MESVADFRSIAMQLQMTQIKANWKLPNPKSAKDRIRSPAANRFCKPNSRGIRRMPRRRLSCQGFSNGLCHKTSKQNKVRLKLSRIPPNQVQGLRNSTASWAVKHAKRISEQHHMEYHHSKAPARTPMKKTIRHKGARAFSWDMYFNPQNISPHSSKCRRRASEPQKLCDHLERITGLPMCVRVIIMAVAWAPITTTAALLITKPKRVAARASSRGITLRTKW
mmetsp:Transcript_70413/g.164955  ORF Transcript_70413/g.164955 Transcript_70413/m.164955 type:complete len:223 (-) Transcript_70413:850-1518(-)